MFLTFVITCASSQLDEIKKHHVSSLASDFTKHYWEKALTNQKTTTNKTLKKKCGKKRNKFQALERRILNISGTLKSFDIDCEFSITAL